MCGSFDCNSCGAAQGTLERGCYNCGKYHKAGSKREKICLTAIKEADNAYVKALEEAEKYAKEYFSQSNPEN